jgi:peptide/nickel transport system substrate-binding protein
MLSRSIMMITNTATHWLPVFSLILWSNACQTADHHDSGKPSFDLSIRLNFEPDRLNPMLSKLSGASQIEGKIFLPLADYDPVRLTYEPVLIKSIPVITPVTDGPFAGGSRYEMEIMEEARWDDSTPVTGYDYLFTMKAAWDPYLVNTAWRSNLGSVVSVEIDQENPRRITVITRNQYILGLEVITNNDIYPEHIYDRDRLLRPYSYSEIIEYDTSKHSTLDSVLRQFANQFNDEKFSRSVISGAGPYAFVEWIPNQHIVLRRKENWWGSAFAERHPRFQANPSSITYYFIPEAQTAITALKDQRIDLVAELSAEQFNELKIYNDQYHTLNLDTPPVLQYYFITYNNDHPILGDRTVRQAISKLMNVKSLIDKLFFGLATRTVGPIPPGSLAYDHSLEPFAFDPDGASQLLKNNGWYDSDSDQILDKVIEGRKYDLTLNILTSNSQLSQDVAIILKAAAEKIGININIVPNELRKILQQVRMGQFDMACLAAVQSIGPYDPYNSWHSDNIGSNGSNYSRFSNQEADRVIDQIRTTLDEKTRQELYKEFQKIIHEEQPTLFLVAPKTPIASSNRLKVTPTPLRPGYFENTFSLQ